VPYCNQCGNLVPEGAKFCQACGSAIHSTGSGSFPPPPPPPGPPLPGASTPRIPFSFPATMDLRPIPVPPDLPFHPQSDEVIYREIIPHPRLRWRLMLGGFLSALVFLVFIIPFSASILLGGVATGALLGIVIFLIVVFAIIVIASIVYANLAYGKFRYWITNHRTVGRRGVIGYSIDSIPLETISDVVVQRSVADRILELSSVWVQPFGGGAAGGYGAAQYRFGGFTGTNSFLGLKPADATNVQQLIFHLRDIRRRETGRLI
jgi:membrane protein YdbS with pleckstrin-like domain